MLILQKTSRTVSQNLFLVQEDISRSKGQESSLPNFWILRGNELALLHKVFCGLLHGGHQDVGPLGAALPLLLRRLGAHQGGHLPKLDNT